MSQYSMSPFTAEPYREWAITYPTSRRVDFFITCRQIPEPKGSAVDGRRLLLGADSQGDNFIVITVATKAHMRELRGCPAMERRSLQWRANAPRYGSWGWYLADVALVRSVFAFAGWTPTPEEARILDALDDYGRRAPARYRIIAA